MKQLTDEQQAILATDGDLKINAVAGSGKTTTLAAYAQSRPAGSKCLYLAFNRTVKEEAKEKFAKAGLAGVRVETAHSLAYKSVVRQRKLDLTPSYKAYELVSRLNIKSRDQEVRFLLATHTQKMLQQYFNSDIEQLKDLNYAASLSDVKARSFADRFAEDLLGYAGKLLAAIKSGEMPCLHDYYLKEYQLSKPRLNYDYLLFDEGQDASGVMLQVLLNQKAHKVIVGDVHQQIYAWRQAVNSLQQVPFPAYSLSSSFRFPDEIAAMARRVLAWKQLFDEPVAFSGLRGLGSHGGPIQSRATLARSNLFLLDRAIQLLHEERLERLWFEGNLAAYTFASDGTSLFDVLALYNGQHSKVRDPMLKSLGSFEKLEAYLEKAEDPELLMLTEMVRKHGSELPSYINRLKNMQVQPEERHQADMIFSTVHRSKGLEYDEVQLTADFITEDKFLRALREKDKGRQLRLNEEINLLYVAMTRARQRLLLPLSLWPAGPVQPVAEAVPTELPGYARRRKQAAFDRADQRQWQWGQLVSEAEADFLAEHQHPNDWLQSQLAYLRREAMKVP